MLTCSGRVVNRSWAHTTRTWRSADTRRVVGIAINGGCPVEKSVVKSIWQLQKQSSSPVGVQMRRCMPSWWRSRAEDSSQGWARRSTVMLGSVKVRRPWIGRSAACRGCGWHRSPQWRRRSIGGSQGCVGWRQTRRHLWSQEMSRRSRRRWGGTGARARLLASHLAVESSQFCAAGIHATGGSVTSSMWRREVRRHPGDHRGLRIGRTGGSILVRLEEWLSLALFRRNWSRSWWGCGRRNSRRRLLLLQLIPEWCHLFPSASWLGIRCRVTRCCLGWTYCSRGGRRLHKMSSGRRRRGRWHGHYQRQVLGSSGAGRIIATAQRLTKRSGEGVLQQMHGLWWGNSLRQMAL